MVKSKKIKTTTFLGISIVLLWIAFFVLALKVADLHSIKMCGHIECKEGEPYKW